MVYDLHKKNISVLLFSWWNHGNRADHLRVTTPNPHLSKCHYKYSSSPHGSTLDPAVRHCWCHLVWLFQNALVVTGVPWMQLMMLVTGVTRQWWTVAFDLFLQWSRHLLEVLSISSENRAIDLSLTLTVYCVISWIISGKNVYVMYPSRWDRLKCVNSGDDILIFLV